MFHSIFQSVCWSIFQLHISIYVSITSISTKEIILFYNYKFISRVGFTKGFTSVLRRIIISLASWQLSIYIKFPLDIRSWIKSKNIYTHFTSTAYTTITSMTSTTTSTTTTTTSTTTATIATNNITTPNITLINTTTTATTTAVWVLLVIHTHSICLLVFYTSIHF